MLLASVHGGAGGSGGQRGRWTLGAAPGRAIAIAFRSDWPCWSRAGLRRRICARLWRRRGRQGAASWGNGWCASESVSEELVTRALGLQWGCPVLGMEFHNPEGLTALVPRLFVDAFGALPLRVAAGKILYLGFEDRLDPALALAVERITGLRVESGLVQESMFGPAHARMLEARFPAVELIEAATETGAGDGADQGSGTDAARRGAPGAGARLPVAAHVAAAAERPVAGTGHNSAM